MLPPQTRLVAAMIDLNWPVILLAILGAVAWRKYREKQGKKVLWYTDLLVAGGLALAASFITGFGESFIPAFTRSFISGFKRSSGGTEPSSLTVYLFLAAVILIPIMLIAVLAVGLRYIWMRKLRQSKKSEPVV